MTAERRGQGPKIEVGHASGKWSQTHQPAFDVDVRFMRGGGRSVVTRTEATAAGFNAELNWPGDGWGLWHPRNGPGEDCSVEWDNDVWNLKDKGILKLTDIRITTKGGALLQPCSLTWCLLEHEHTGIELEVGAAHLDLSNTEKRRQANLEECHALRGHYRTSRAQHPQRRHMISFDGNRNQRDPRWRDYFEANLFAGTGLKSGWHRPFPASGTHGKSLLDITAADFPLETSLARDDAASDHRPTKSTGRL